jgi:hypothetical protein
MNALPRLPVGVIGRQRTAVIGGLHRQRDPQCPWQGCPVSKAASPGVCSDARTDSAARGSAQAKRQSARASERIYWNLLRQGCSGRSLQVIGWSGRHPRGRETRRNRWQARSADHPPCKAFVFRTDTFSPRASHRVPTASHLIAGFSPHEQLAARGAPSRPPGCALGRRDAVQGCARSTGLWLLGLVGVYRVGDLVHVFLLVGLMLLLLAMLKARDAALRPPNPPTED